MIPVVVFSRRRVIRRLLQEIIDQNWAAELVCCTFQHQVLIDHAGDQANRLVIIDLNQMGAGAGVLVSRIRSLNPTSWLLLVKGENSVAADIKSIVSPKRVRCALLDTELDRVKIAEGIIPELLADIHYRLTVREIQVFKRLCMGCSRKIIAMELKISLGTVVVHHRNISRKTGSSNLADMTRAAVMLGLCRFRLADSDVELLPITAEPALESFKSLHQDSTMPSGIAGGPEYLQELGNVRERNVRERDNSY
jgi:DNA-binding CsgD family transcriptional regulator